MEKKKKRERLAKSFQPFIGGLLVRALNKPLKISYLGRYEPWS